MDGSRPKLLADAMYPERGSLNGDGSDGRDRQDAGRQEAYSELGTCGEVCESSPLNGFWRDADWLFCRDEKWRPVEPGAFPLAHGSAARVGRLRMYGDGIVVPVAEAFIKAAREAIDEQA